MIQKLSETVPAALRAELARRGLLKGAFAKQLGHDETWLYRRLTGRAQFTLGDIDAMCQALDLAPAALVSIAAAVPAPAPKKTTAGGVNRRRSTQPPSGERNGQ